MGCIAIEKKLQDRLTIVDYRFIWNKCLKIDGVILNNPKKTYHPCFQQIGKDINRTFPGHPFFQQIQNRNKFQRVLRSFALQFPRIGYTQGLNFLVGFLLISNCNEQQVLKTLLALCTHQQLMLLGLYDDQFPLVRLYCDIFWQISKKVCPQAHRILTKTNLPDQLWIFQWFLTLFIYSFPLSYIQHFLNFIVVKRYFAAVRLAVAIVQCLEHYLSVSGLMEDGFLQCLELLKTQEFCQKYLPIQDIIKKAQKISKELILECLHETTQGNWYRRYFSIGTPNWQHKHTKMMMTLNQQRQKFHKSDEVATRYSRLPSTINIIDQIEESMVKKYERTVLRSSVERLSAFFQRLSSKQYQSMGALDTKIQQ